MSYTHKVIEFYGDPINFFINNENVFIGMKSIINSIGLEWSSQLARIKTVFKGKIQRNNFPAPTGTYITSCLNRHDAIRYLQTINTRKLTDIKREKLNVYKKEFPPFSYKQADFGNQVEIEDFYLGSIEGIKQLIYDAVIKLGNEKAIEQLALILFPLLTEPIISNDHIEILGPAYDMAEKTADRQNELIKHKSTSISKQLEIVAETIRDSDRKSSLELRRISKSLY